MASTIKARWVCEQAHQQMKEELVVDHFEGRSWTGLHRHALMTCIACAYLQNLRLTGPDRTDGGKKTAYRDRQRLRACPAVRQAIIGRLFVAVIPPVQCPHCQRCFRLPSDLKVPMWGPDAQDLGRFRGGLSTKIHLACHALDNPVRLLPGPDQQNEVVRVAERIAGLDCDFVIANRAYDADHVQDTILEAQAQPVIPPWSNLRLPHAYDRHFYNERNLIERCFAKLKQFRRVATRFDKRLANFLGFANRTAIAV